eukprot:GILJ01002919.1.p1 GENE.GILJ01002919.1~~GILJ01002919.1.p1  ORF type:complete len:820 (+),score=104.32 GILJ01002919.1:264-2462(+)
MNEISGGGRYSYPDGSYYEGQVYKGLRHGSGTFACADGVTEYSGQWEEGKRQGHGKLTYNSERTAYYDGVWKAGLKNGKGKMVFASGNTYDGDWVSDKKQGHGTMVWVQLNEKYVGEWKDNKPDGFGVHIWMTDRGEGNSQLRNRYEGMWEAGKRQGKGAFYYANGSKYIGEWVNNLKEGYGKFTFEDGTVYQGLFRADRMVSAPQNNAVNLSPRVQNPEDSDLIQTGLDITDLLELEKDPSQCVKDMQNVLLRYNSDIRVWYKYYSNASSNESAFSMKMKDLWRFVRDCRVLTPNVSLAAIDRMFVRGKRNLYSMNFEVNELLASESDDEDVGAVEDDGDQQCGRKSSAVNMPCSLANGDVDVVSTALDINLSREAMKSHRSSITDIPNGTHQKPHEPVVAEMRRPSAQDVSSVNVAKSANPIILIRPDIQVTSSAVASEHEHSTVCLQGEEEEEDGHVSRPDTARSSARSVRSSSSMSTASAKQRKLDDVHNPERPILLRHFMECLVRIAYARYENEQPVFANRIAQLFTSNLLPNACKNTQDREETITLEMPQLETVLREFDADLKRVFNAYATSSSSIGGRLDTTITVRRFTEMAKNANLVTEQDHRNIIELCVGNPESSFKYGNTAAGTGSVQGYYKHIDYLETELTYYEFVETMVRWALQQIPDSETTIEGRVSTFLGEVLLSNFKEPQLVVSRPSSPTPEEQELLSLSMEELIELYATRRSTSQE